VSEQIDSNSEFEDLKAEIRAFAVARNWEQFHTPKNLAMAVAGEAGELVAEFQWLTAKESEVDALTPEQLKAISLEIADVQIYLLRLADVLKLDIPTAVRAKLEINEDRF
jgi:NTP pyrophosphatase (non-canonical NTP hydrolase)